MVKYQNKKFRPNDLIQKEAMKSNFPSLKYKKTENGYEFSGDLFIKPELPVYNITVRYKKGSVPKVFINNPILADNCPHIYKEGNICLYSPDNYHWRPDMLIAGKIMHWTIAWIYFYEVWLETNVWYGPEVVHVRGPKQ